jgi:riboflavin synthase
MFTGIIEGLGSIAEARRSDRGMLLTVDADFDLTGSGIGDSIAVNGACLTVVAIGAKRFSADVSPETLDKTTFGKVKIGERVNLERALRLSDRIDGHLVSGHIDGLGVIKSKQNRGNAVIVSVETPAALAHYMIWKGSVAVDGISLTINACDSNGFEVSVIPHTAKITTIGFKRAGDNVNIETDMIGKYVERFTAGIRESDKPGAFPTVIDRAYLLKKGFI